MRVAGGCMRLVMASIRRTMKLCRPHHTSIDVHTVEIEWPASSRRRIRRADQQQQSSGQGAADRRRRAEARRLLVQVGQLCGQDQPESERDFGRQLQEDSGGVSLCHLIG